MEFFFDFVSPYAYFASTQIDPLGERFGRKVAWKPLLVGVTVTKVMGLKPLPQTPLKSDYIAHDKPRMAKLLGIPFRQPDMTGVSSVAALRAYMALDAQSPSMARAFAHEIFRRLWVENLGIDSEDAISQACDAIGTGAPLRTVAVAAMTSDEGRHALKTAVDEAIARGVFGTPFFIVDGEPIWGVDRLWMVEHWLRHRSWEPQPAV
ncbi:2-hydroxychromene-2-carboxylate isomerase [Variovorax sp. VNK109]|jgi:2-hydroxychromene-2-carboxylate isomerase|uniref:2-hydroxychromene-2-carboxylate isomerase n=1 Tax=Variovorax sp. VNK109 TaxID=3400919 RepID=UPI003C01F07C